MHKYDVCVLASVKGFRVLGLKGRLYARTARSKPSEALNPEHGVGGVGVALLQLMSCPFAPNNRRLYRPSCESPNPEHAGLRLLEWESGTKMTPQSQTLNPKPWIEHADHEASIECTLLGSWLVLVMYGSMCQFLS